MKVLFTFNFLHLLQKNCNTSPLSPVYDPRRKKPCLGFSFDSLSSMFAEIVYAYTHQTLAKEIALKRGKKTNSWPA